MNVHLVCLIINGIHHLDIVGDDVASVGHNPGNGQFVKSSREAEEIGQFHKG